MVKVCPSCSASVPDSASVCPSCEHEFPEAEAGDETGQTLMGMSLDGGDGQTGDSGPRDTQFGLPTSEAEEGEQEDLQQEDVQEDDEESQTSSDDLLDIGDEKTVPARSEDLLGDLGFGGSDEGDADERADGAQPGEAKADEEPSEEPDDDTSGPSSTQFGMPAVDPSEEADRQRNAALEDQKTSPADEETGEGMDEDSAARWFGEADEADDADDADNSDDGEDGSNDDLFAAWGIDEDSADDPKQTMHGLGPEVDSEADPSAPREAGAEETSEADARYQTQMGMGPPNPEELYGSDRDEEGVFDSVVYEQQDTPTHELDADKVEEFDRQVREWDSRVERFPEDPDKDEESRSGQATDQESLEVDDEARWFTGTVEKAIEDGKGPNFPDPDESPEASPEAREQRDRPEKAAQSGIIRLPGQSNKGTKPDESAEERNLGASGVLNLPGQDRRRRSRDDSEPEDSREQPARSEQSADETAEASESEGRDPKDSGLFGNSTYMMGGEGSEADEQGQRRASPADKSGVFGDESQGPTGFQVEESEAIELDEKLDSRPFPGGNGTRGGRDADGDAEPFAAVEHSEMSEEGLGEDSLEEVDFSHMDDEDSAFEFMDEDEQSAAWLGSVADEEDSPAGAGTARFGDPEAPEDREDREDREEAGEQEDVEAQQNADEPASGGDAAGAFPELDSGLEETGRGASAEMLLGPSEAVENDAESTPEDASDSRVAGDQDAGEQNAGEQAAVEAEASTDSDEPTEETASAETPELDGGAIVGLIGGVLLAGYAVYGPVVAGLPAAGVGIVALVVAMLGALWAFIGSTIFPSRMRTGGHLLVGIAAVGALGAAAFSNGAAPMELLGLAGGVLLVLSGVVSGRDTEESEEDTDGESGREIG